MGTETFDFTRCQRPDGTYYGTDGKCVKGVEVDDADVDTSMVSKGVALSKSDLDKMEDTFNNFRNTGELKFPFKTPEKYDDNSGTVEAVDEICTLRDSLSQDKKTGKIGVPSGVEVSPKAKELIDEWNSLDLSRVYVNSKQGNKLNVSGLGVMAGPRDSVPKDAIRGLVQYAALMRQDANLIDTPKGKVIDTYRDPFTGKRRPFEGDTGKADVDVVASQDHWERPFGIYGIKSENDVRNTVYMPISMNVAKGESSPARYLHRVLVANGRMQGTAEADASALGGFVMRYDKNKDQDYLPKGVTRDTERSSLNENVKWMFDRANKELNEKYIPKMEKELNKGTPMSYSTAAKLLSDVAKRESTINYFGGLIKFAQGGRIFNEFEQNLFSGINLKTSTGDLEKGIEEKIRASGASPEGIIQQIVSNRRAAAVAQKDADTTPAPKPVAKKAESAPKPVVSTPSQSSRSRLTLDQKAQLRAAVSRVGQLQEEGLSEGAALSRLTPAQRALFQQFT